MLKLRHLFSQLKRQQILNSSYDQLVERIARTYNLKEYKNQSGLCLLQMHHQFKLFTPGDWVLDVGSGNNYAWSDLALKLTQNDDMSHRVISNDIIDLRKGRQNNVFIQGDINEQPVQTKIALQLQNHNLDTIMIDVSPPFTGNINRDGRDIMRSVGGVMNLAHNFLKKGGNMVCKVLQSQAQPLLDETFQLYFNQKYKYVPSIMRKTSPVCFYVMKGFLMSESFHALNDFIAQYKGSTEKKMKLVEKYHGKYSWDPVKVIRKHILNDIMSMRNEGRSDKDIIKVFGTDPYAKAQKTLKLLKQSEDAQKDRNMVLHFKLLNQLTQGQLYKNAQQMPTSEQQFYQMMLENMDKVIREDKQKKSEKRQKVSRAPLKENQTYMKVEDKVKQQEDIVKQYLEGDLHGRYSGRQTKEEVEQEMDKIHKVHPEIDRLVSQMQSATKSTSQKTIEDILQENKHKMEELSAESLRNIQESVEESIRNMSTKEVEEEKKMQSEIYRTGIIDDRVQKADRYINQRRSKRKRPLY